MADTSYQEPMQASRDIGVILPNME